MNPAPKPENDRARLNALCGYELLDTAPEEALDVITKLAASLCEVPIAVISLVDEHRQWFKSQCGLSGVASTARDVAFCAHAILQTDIFEVTDATLDSRFADNPLVIGQPRIRFYAGMPLIDPFGMALGALCVIDRKPGKLTQTQRDHLRTLASAVVCFIGSRIRRARPLEERLAKKYAAGARLALAGTRS